MIPSTSRKGLVTTFIPFSFLLLLLLPVTVAANSLVIRGKVLEKGTRKPLESVTVTVGRQPSVFALTDDQGAFSLSLSRAGVYTLTAAALGFAKSEPVEVDTADAGSVTLYLEPGLTIPDIVVKGERNPDQLSKTIIEGEELRMIAGSRNDPLLAMTAMPGITFDAGAPAMRGSGPGDNIYLVDFLPVGHLFHMGGLISTINGDLVEDFQLYKSAFGPELYVSDDVTGSAVDVTLRRPREDRMGLKLHTSLLESDFLVEGPVSDNQSFYFGARRSYFELFLSEIEADDDVTMAVPEYADYQGKYIWKLNEADTLSLQLGGASDSIEFTIGEDAEIAETDPQLVGESFVDIVDHNHGAVWIRRTTSGTVNKMAVGRLVVTSDIDFSSIADLSVDQENFYFREQATLLPGKNHELTLGGGYLTSSTDLFLDAFVPTCTEFDPDCTYKDARRTHLDDNIRVNYANVFLKDRWRVTEPLTLIGGLRVTHDDYTGLLIADPRAALELSLQNEVKLTAGWGRYHQMPEYKYISSELGNPDLDKVESDHYVLGAEKGFGQGWSVKTEGYYKTFDQLVTSDPLHKYANNGVGRAYGVDLLVRKTHTERLSGWFGVTFSKAERKDKVQGRYFDFSYDRPLDMKLVVNYRQSSKWTFGGKWVYRSGKPYTPVIGINGFYPDGSVRPVYGELNSERLPDYHALDLRAERAYLHDRWKMALYFEVMNVYAQQNIEGYTYNRDYSKKKPVHGLPIIPFVGIRAEF